MTGMLAKVDRTRAAKNGRVRRPARPTFEASPVERITGAMDLAIAHLRLAGGVRPPADASQLALRSLLTHKDPAVRSAAVRALEVAHAATAPPLTDTELRIAITHTVLWAAVSYAHGPDRAADLTWQIADVRADLKRLALERRTADRLRIEALRDETIGAAIEACASAGRRGRPRRGAPGPAPAMHALLRELGVAIGDTAATGKFMARHGLDPDLVEDLVELYRAAGEKSDG